MIGRRLLQKRVWTSGRRWLFPSSPLSPVPAEYCKRYFSTHGLAAFSSSGDNPVNVSYLLKIPYTRNKCKFFSSNAVADLPTNGIVDVPLAQTGEGIAECELLKWFVQEGDEVDDFQPLCEVQSDKATIEITSRYKGRVAQVLHVPGSIVKVGETLLKMVVEENQIPPVILGNLENEKHCDTKVNKDCTGGVLSTPAVRNLAKEHGININEVQGTGKDSRVSKEDVLKYAAQKSIIGDPSFTATADLGELLHGETSSSQVSGEVSGHYEDTIIPLRGFQRTMVKTMSMAAKVPHFHYVEEIDCDALAELKASFQTNNSESVPHNIGIAMATPFGLVVPNIKNVQSLSIFEITKELSRLQQLALDNKLSTDDISCGTITLSNIGAIGGKFGAPIVNLPEVAIIATGRIQKLPRVADDGDIYFASIMTVNIGADHRVLDGATVARFCNEWKRFIEKPELLMLHMK